MSHWQKGDKICIFGACLVVDLEAKEPDRRLCATHETGFSRGAYTARALAGFLFKVRLPLQNLKPAYGLVS